jgi:tRNA pseudouridine(38-40) synthase
VLTIESELERSLFEAGCIAPYNYGDLKKSGWQRAARTDKGVHAVANVVNVKIQLKNDLIEDQVPEKSADAEEEKKVDDPAAGTSKEEEIIDKRARDSDDEGDNKGQKGGHVKRCYEFRKIVEMVNERLPPEIRIFCTFPPCSLKQLH